jgi:hypothetical protein
VCIVALDLAGKEEVQMQKGPDERRARRQETLRRLNADEELFATSKARSDATEEERQRKLKNEIEKEQEINRGWFARRFGAGG